MDIKQLANRIPRPYYMALLGTEVQEVRPDEGRVRVAYTGKQEFCNPGGFVQGGFLASMLDDAMGLAVVIQSRGELYPSTIDMNVSFLAPARAGRLVVEAAVVKLGKTIGFVEGELRNGAGEPVARGTCSVRISAMEAVRSTVAQP